jgi:membrane-associated phospholipid phosphatase
MFAHGDGYLPDLTIRSKVQRGGLSSFKGLEGMYSVFLSVVLHSAAGTPAQSSHEFPGRGAYPRGDRLPRLIPPPSYSHKLPLPARKADLVILWNQTLLQAIKTERTPPPLAARNMAMVHIAIYDAVNAVHPICQPYGIAVQPPQGTSARAAAASAAHRVLIDLYPKLAPRFQAILHRSLAGIPAGPSKADGITLGQFVAAKVLASRKRDGSGKKVRYIPGSGPGLWKPTPPHFLEPLLPQWPKVACFAMRNGSQFRPAPPPALTSAAYTAAYREVKVLGAKHSARRTPDQTRIAWFWADVDGTVTPPGHWNRIAQTVALARGNTLVENARLFALLNITLADAGVLCWDSKYQYHFWRPIHAIRKAGITGNLATRPQRNWMPLITTPPFPSYTSGHSTFSGAAAAVLRIYFGTDHVPFTDTSESWRGGTRSFSRFSQAAAEAGQSRIYGGIHWQFDNTEGLASGRRLGEYVCRHFLVPYTQGARGAEPSFNDGPGDTRFRPKLRRERRTGTARSGSERQRTRRDWRGRPPQ